MGIKKAANKRKGKSPQETEELSRVENEEVDMYKSSLDPEIHERFPTKLKNRTLLVEKMFNPGPNAGDIEEMIAALGLTKLVKEKTPPVKDVVLEFYAAIAASRDYNKVLVRDTWVNFSGEAIKKLYELLDLCIEE